MSWGAGEWLWVLPLACVVGVIVLYAGWMHARRLQGLFSGAMLERILPRSVRIRRWIRDGAGVIALFALVIAMAEPRFGKTVVEIERKGVDIVLCLDLSRSMDARDVSPSRLERMRREVFDLVDRMEGDRVGMVIYAGGAWPRMPLTRDTDALSLLVRELDTSVFQAQGSELGMAIRTAVELLDDPASAAGKAILVMSDGEVHRADDALAAAGEAKAQGIRIYGMGIGQEPARVPLPDGTFLQHEGGTVISAPSHDVLKDVARLTGGAYVDSVASGADIEQLYGREIRGTLKSVSTGTLQREVWNTGFQWPLGLGLLLVFVAGWLGDGRKRAAGGLAAVVLAVAMLAPGPAWAEDKAMADKAYRNGNYPRAMRILEDLAAQNPSDSDVYGRLGAARYRSGDFDGAARAFETQARLLGDSSEAWYNAGNAHYKAGRLEKALQSYDRVLTSRPKHERAQANFDLVTQELEARRQKQQEQQQQQEGEGGQAPEEGGDETQDQQQQKSAGEQEGDEQESNDQQQGEGESGEGENDDPSGQPSNPQDQKGGGENPEDESEAVGLDELESKDEGDEGDEGEGTTDQTAEEGAMTTEQAERLLEGVEEGTPRIQVEGRKGSKPW